MIKVFTFICFLVNSNALKFDRLTGGLNAKDNFDISPSNEYERSTKQRNIVVKKLLGLIPLSIPLFFGVSKSNADYKGKLEYQPALQGLDYGKVRT
jgi:hypothetical protein